VFAGFFSFTPPTNEASARKIYYLTLHVNFVVCFYEKLTFLNLKVMSAYDITEFMRTAYGPIAYWVPSTPPLTNTAYQTGVSPSHMLCFTHLKQRYWISDCDNVYQLQQVVLALKKLCESLLRRGVIGKHFVRPIPISAWRPVSVLF